MRAEIISIGTEILLADIQDTNAHYIAQRLPALGIDLYYMHQIGDNQARLSELMQTALQRSDLVLCTGGLGPTEDDITRDAIAAAVGETASINADAEAPPAQLLLQPWHRHARNATSSRPPSSPPARSCPTRPAPPRAGGWKTTTASSSPCPARPPK